MSTKDLRELASETNATLSTVENRILTWGIGLAAGLSSVHSPSIGPCCLLIFEGMLESGNHALSLLQSDCHALWDALMSFVCAEWTPARKQHVSKVLKCTGSRCPTCGRLGTNHITLRTVLAADSAFDLFLRTVCACLGITLRSRIQRGKGYISSSGRWPTTSEQLFPYGPERTIAALISHLTCHPCVDIVLVTLISLDRPLAFPSLMQASNRARVIAFVTDRLAACMSAFEADVAKIRPPVLPAVRTALALRHFAPCDTTALIVHAACFGIDQEADGADAAAFCRGYEHELFSAFHPIASELHGQEPYYWVSNIAGQLWFWRLADGKHTGALPAYAPQGLQTLNDLADPYRALRFYMQLRPRAANCQGPGCGASVRDKETPGALARCGKYGFPRYCSRACQRADWTRGAVPHKEVCAELKAIAPLLSGEVLYEAAAFSAACAARALPLATVDKLIFWATCGETKTDYASGEQQSMEVHDLFVRSARLILPNVAE